MSWTVHLEGGPRRVNHASVAINDFIYSFGGYCYGEDYRSFSTMDIHILNTNNYRWSLLPQKKGLMYPSVPFQRYGHTAVAYESKIYIWGGRNDEMVCDILFCFDTKTLQWSKPQVSGNMPGARDGHSACIVGNCMYICSGFGLEQFSSDVYSLNLLTMKWRLIQTFGEMPSHRDFHTASVINDRMYIFGGRNVNNEPCHIEEDTYCSTIMYLDLKTNYWHTPKIKGKVPAGRRSHSAFIYKSMIYIFGGFNHTLDMHFNDLYCFDPGKNEWNMVDTIGNIPQARRRQSCIIIGKRMFMFGGTCPLLLLGIKYGPYGNDLFDYNDTHVLDFRPSLKTLSIMSVIQHKLDHSELPNEIQFEIRMMITPNQISHPITHTG